MVPTPKLSLLVSLTNMEMHCQNSLSRHSNIGLAHMSVNMSEGQNFGTNNFEASRLIPVDLQTNFYDY